MAEPAPNSEKLPTNEMINVLEYVTISKNESWWTAIVLAGDAGRKKVMLYMLHKSGDKWSRKQKFTIPRKTDWPLIRDTVEKMMSKVD